MTASYKFKFNPTLSEMFKGIIWRVETDDHSTIVAIESRDVSNRTTYFSAFDYVSGEAFFKEITVQEGWFWSLDRVHSGMIYLHSYVNESSPEHKGIIALNSSGEIAWQHFHKTLHEISDSGLIVYNPKIQPKIFELISAETGEVLSTKISGDTPLQRDIVIPEILEDSRQFSHLLPGNTYGPVFYLEINRKIILAFHTQKENFYTQQLAVYQDGTPLMQDILAADIQKLNPEAFFIQHNHLFYIRGNKQEFVSYLV